MLEDTTAAPAESGQQAEQTTQPAAQPDNQATEAAVEQTAAEGATSQPATETPGTEGEEHKRNNVSARERIKQLVDQRDNERAEVARLRARLAEQEKTAQQVKDPLEYGSDADHIAAVAKAAAEQVARESLKTQAEDAERRHAAVTEAAWQERVLPFREKAPDFDQVAYSHPHMTPLMAEVIKTSEFGPEVAYHLGKNLSDAQRIAGLPPLMAAVELGRLSQRFAAPAAPRTTGAPRPPTTLQGHGSASTEDPEKMTTEQFRAWRAKQ